MGEEQDVIKVVINKQSIFHFREFYEFTYNLVKSLNYDIVEDNFTRKEEDISFHWTCSKPIDPDTKYVIDITTQITGMKTVKVKRGELTENMDKATTIMTIKGLVVTEWMNKYGINPQVKFFKGIIDKYFKKSSFEDRKEDLKRNVYLLNNEISSFFEIPRFL